MTPGHGLPDGIVALARVAMATRFEVVLHGDDPVRLRAAGEEALQEIARLEQDLSFYRPSGALGRLNRSPVGEWQRVPSTLFEALSRARDLWESTGGSFDPAVGALMTAWGLTGTRGHVPVPEALRQARERSGFVHWSIDRDGRRVRRDRDGVMVDLGGIGKGYAIDCAIDLLRDLGVPGALVHGGTSTIAAIGTDPQGSPWRIAVPEPGQGGAVRSVDAPDTARAVLGVVELVDASLSVSEVRGKGFEAEGRFHGHILDPRTGQPTDGALLSAVRADSATATDALATALLVLGRDAGSAPAFRGAEDRYLAVFAQGADGPERIGGLISGTLHTNARRYLPDGPSVA